jgi:hypothetical protein
MVLKMARSLGFAQMAAFADCAHFRDNDAPF